LAGFSATVGDDVRVTSGFRGFLLGSTATFLKFLRDFFTSIVSGHVVNPKHDDQYKNDYLLAVSFGLSRGDLLRGRS
jgi:hypothetical protein